MTRYSTYFRLLAFVNLFNLTRSSLHGIQYRSRSVNANARVIARCARRVTSALFEPSSRVVVIVPENSTANVRSSSADNFLRFLTNDDDIDNTVTVVNVAGFRLQVPRRNRIDRESSYVVMEDDIETLHSIFQIEEITKWSEYLIITRMNDESLHHFANSLWQRGFLKIAFFDIKDRGKLVLRYFAETRGDSSDLTEPIMKSLTVCKTDNFGADSSIRPFSRILCPNQGCYITVGRVKNDMTGSADVAKSRSVFDSTDHIVKDFVERYQLKWTDRSYAERNWTENLDLIRRKKIDLIYGRFIPRTEGLANLDFATWFGFETIAFVDMTEKTRPPPLAQIFFPFEGYVWICLIAVLVVYSIFALAIERAHEKKLITETITYFHVWAILLGQGVRYPSKIGFRTVLGLWMIGSFIVNAAYSCAFKSALAPNKKTETLKTIHDINHSGRWIAGPEVARELFNNSDDETDREIVERWRVVRSDEVFPTVIDEHIVGVDYVLNVRLHNTLYRKRRQPNLYTLRDPILVYPLNFYLSKRHPYLKHFRKFVAHATAAGLVEKRNIDEMANFKYREWIRNVLQPLQRRYRWEGKMRIRQLRVALIIWASGFSIAIAVFLYELHRSSRIRYWIKLNKTKKQKRNENKKKDNFLFSKEKMTDQQSSLFRINSVIYWGGSGSNPAVSEMLTRTASGMSVAPR